MEEKRALPDPPLPSRLLFGGVSYPVETSTEMRPDEVAFGPASLAAERIMRGGIVHTAASAPAKAFDYDSLLAAIRDMPWPPINTTGSARPAASYHAPRYYNQGGDPAYLHWVQAQLARFTYKPGWKLEARSGIGGYLQIVVQMHVEDTYNPGQWVDVVGGFTLQASYGYMDDDEDRFARQLAGHLKDMEIHESREWLKRDGEILDNPHAPRDWSKGKR